MFVVSVQASLYLSELQSAVACLVLAATASLSVAVIPGFIGSISVSAEVMASRHCARSSLIISSGSQAALGPAERNRISAAFSTSCLLMWVILCELYLCSSVAGPAGFDAPMPSEKVTTRNGFATVPLLRATCRDAMSMIQTASSRQ